MKIPVICYHSVGFKYPSWVNNFLTMELSYFESQLKYFARHYQTIFLREQWDIRNGSLAGVKNPLVITFDDGYLDNWIWGFPLLKKYGLKATIFVSPSNPFRMFKEPQASCRWIAVHAALIP